MDAGQVEVSNAMFVPVLPCGLPVTFIQIATDLLLGRVSCRVRCRPECRAPTKPCAFIYCRKAHNKWKLNLCRQAYPNGHTCCLHCCCMQTLSQQHITSAWVASAPALHPTLNSACCTHCAASLLLATWARTHTCMWFQFLASTHMLL